MSQKVLVCGATGNTGRPLLHALQQRGAEPIAAVTHPDRGNTLPRGIETRVCRLGNEQELSQALEGVEGLFMLVPFDEQMVEHGQQLVRLAQQQSVQRIVRLTAWQAATDGPNRMAQLHGTIDRAVSKSGIPYHLLRCNSFMQNYAHMYAGLLRKRQAIGLAEANALAGWIDCRDIAEVAAQLLVAHDESAPNLLDLTGPELLSNHEIVATLSALTGTFFQYHELPQSVVSEGYRKLGLSEWKIEVLESLTQSIRDGHMANLSNSVQQVLGRAPRTMRDFLEEHQDCFINKNQ